jgi:hypothetical protein
MPPRRWAFFLEGDSHAIARTGIDLGNFAVDFVFRLQGQAGKVGIIAQIINHDPLHRHIEGPENQVDKVMGERAFPFLLLQEEGDAGAHPMINVDTECLLSVSQEDGDPAIGRNQSDNLHLDQILCHSLNLHHAPCHWRTKPVPGPPDCSHCHDRQKSLNQETNG